MTTWIKGNLLPVAEQRKALARFVHRYTKDHVPAWAVAGDRMREYSPQFASDADWLANTQFAVRKDGRLDEREHYCISYPTWPDGK